MITTENGVYFLENAERKYKINSGDIIFVSNDSNKILNAGDKYKNYNAIISEIIKRPKHWWQFWRKSKVMGYHIMFL